MTTEQQVCDRFCKCHEWLDVSGWFKGYDDNDARERAIAWAEAEPAIRFYEMGAAYPVGRAGSREYDIATYYAVNIWAGFDRSCTTCGEALRPFGGFWVHAETELPDHQPTYVGGKGVHSPR